MNFIDNIKEQTIIICNSGTKEAILKTKKLKKIKIMSRTEFIKKACFSYDEEAILYLMKKYNYIYEVASMYIDNLYYIENEDYQEEKLIFLKKIKEELDSNNLLKYNYEFKNYIKRTPIIIYNLRIDKFLEKILSGLNYSKIENNYKEYNHQVLSFNTVEEELEYIANKICHLIDTGIDINNIKLTNVDKSYFSQLERIFSLHRLKVNIKYSIPLFSYEEVKKFIDIYKNSTIKSALEAVKEKDFIYKEIVQIINDNIKYNNKDLIIYKIENKYLEKEKYLNAIDIIDLLDYIPNENEYIFMLGFNDGIIPASYKDDEYLDDSIKNNLNLENTALKNHNLREDIINSIKRTKNLTITYKLSDKKTNYYPSTLCDEFEVIDGINEYTYSYSETFNKLKLAKCYDEYQKYGYKNTLLDILNSNFKINYNSYNNKYHKIDEKIDNINLSYTKLEMYNKCAFRYYLTYILKLDIFEENFSTIIGSMVHFIMENVLKNEDYNPDKYLSTFLENKEFTNKEKFFLNKYREAISDLINEVLLEKKFSKFNKAMYEKEIEINFLDNAKFKGIIDKILYYEENNKTYIALVDYKTGSDDISLKYLKYGLNMQLPIYLYLSTKIGLENRIYTGFYLQKLNITDKDYRLEGYSNSDKEVLSVIDDNYEKSQIIKGMKTLKDGNFSTYSKVLSSSEIENLIKITEEKILEVIEKIKHNSFEINPKIDGDKEIGCKYCKYKDICFMNKSDEIPIKAIEFGGEE